MWKVCKKKIKSQIYILFTIFFSLFILSQNANAESAFECTTDICVFVPDSIIMNVESDTNEAIIEDLLVTNLSNSEKIKIKKIKAENNDRGFTIRSFSENFSQYDVDSKNVGLAVKIGEEYKDLSNQTEYNYDTTINENSNTTINFKGKSSAFSQAITNTETISPAKVILTLESIPKSAKAILTEDGNLNFIYSSGTYTKGESYSYSIDGADITSTIKSVYNVPKTSSSSNKPSWIGKSFDYHTDITSANFDSSFKDFSPTSTSYWFYDDRYLSSITNTQNLNISKVTSMYCMFYNAGYSATTFDIGNLDNWNVSRVTDMSYMFYNAGRSAAAWNIGDLSNWNVSNVTGMSNMFSYAGYSADTWNIGNLGNWNVGSVTNMYSMFNSAGYSAAAWNIGDLSNWNVSNVTRMSSMFYNAGYSATTFDIGNLDNWNVSRVTDMSYMFYNAGRSAAAWNIGDLSNWNVSNVTDMSSMFSYAGRSATAWNIGDLSNWNVSNVTSMSNMFFSAGYSAAAWDIGNLDNWNVSNVTYMEGMFGSSGYSAATWNIGNLNNWNVSKVKKISYMFSSAGHSTTSWSIGNLSNWNVSSVTDMEGMFNSAGYSSTTWNIGNLSTKTISAADSPTGESYIAWDISKVEIFGANSNTLAGSYGTFENIAHSVIGGITLDLSGWTPTAAKRMKRMFKEANVKTIYCENDWATIATQIGTGISIFDQNTNLVGGNNTKGGRSQDISYAHPDAGTSNPGFFTNINDIPCYGKEILQNFTDNMIVGETRTLCDERDGKEYVVAKTPDNNLWMTTNLDLDLVANGENGGALMTKSNGITTVTPLTSENTNLPEGTSYYPEYSTQTTDDIYWEYDDITNNMPDYSYDSGIHEDGNYYNIMSASAGAAVIDIANTQFKTNNTSICPAGWTMANQDDYRSLIQLNGIAIEEDTYNSSNQWIGITETTEAVQYLTDRVTGIYIGDTFTKEIEDAGINAYQNGIIAFRYDEGENEYTYELYSLLRDIDIYITSVQSGSSVRCLMIQPKTITLSFDKNTEEDVMIPESQQQENVTRNATFTIPSDIIPTRNDFIFGSWTDNEGRHYYPGEEIELSVSKTLFADWLKKVKDDQDQTIEYIQNMTNSICESLDSEIQYGMKDQRDEKIYSISKLEDGNCWMTSDLRLDLDSNGSNKLTNENTDLLRNTWTPTEDTTAINDCIETCTYSTKVGNTYYYSQVAATAESAEDNATFTLESICPNGWYLPTRNNYQALLDNYLTEENDLSQDPIRLNYNGMMEYNELYYKDMVAGYWTSSISRYDPYSLGSYKNNETYISDDMNEDGKISVRCMFDIPTERVVSLEKNTDDDVQNFPEQTQIVAQTYHTTVSIQLPETTPTRTGSKFNGWGKTSSSNIYNGLYEPGTTVRLGEETDTLYAIWQNATYLIFEINPTDEEVENMPTQRLESYRNGNSATFTIPDNVPTKEGSRFIGWTITTGSNWVSCQPGDTYTREWIYSDGETFTLYPIWEEYIPLGILTEDGMLTFIKDGQDYDLDGDFTYSIDGNTEITSKIEEIYDVKKQRGTRSSSIWIQNDNILSVNVDKSYKSYKPTTQPHFNYDYYLGAFYNMQNMNMSNVVSTSRMFLSTGRNADSFTLDISSWDTSNVTDMSNMFTESGPDTSAWNVSGLSNLNTSKVRDMNGMFSGVAKAGDFILDINTKLVSASESITGEEYVAWDTSNVTDMNGMFYRTGNKKGDFIIDLSLWNTSNVTDMSRMFMYNGSDNDGIGPEKDTVWSIGNINTKTIEATNSTTGQKYIAWNTGKVTDMSGMFSRAGDGNRNGSMTCTSDNNFILDISAWDTSNVTDMSEMFKWTADGRIITFGDISNWNTSKVTNMSEMFSFFAICKENEWPLGNLNTKTVTITRDNNEITYTAWDVSNVTNVYYMFGGTGIYQTASVPNFDLSSWNVSKVTDMSCLFGFTPIKILDLSSWNTANVTKMQQMFENSRLRTIYVGLAWTTQNVTDNGNNMFDRDSQLVGGSGSSFADYEIKDISFAHIDGGPSNPGYFTLKSASSQQSNSASMTYQSVVQSYPELENQPMEINGVQKMDGYDIENPIENNPEEEQTSPLGVNSENGQKMLFICITCGVVLFIILFFIFFLLYKRRKKKEEEIIEELD